MSEQPTKAQIKEFWEWCGFKYTEESEDHIWYVLVYPDGHGDTAWRILPPIDLNNLFKYAVSKLIKSHELRIVTDRDGTYMVGILFYPNSDAPVIEGDASDKDPALALFWAIQKLIKIGESDDTR